MYVYYIYIYIYNSKVTVPIDSMSCGNTPWSCPNFDGEIAIHRLEPSSFVGDIWELSCVMTEDEEEGPVIYVNLYIDH